MAHEKLLCDLNGVMMIDLHSVNLLFFFLIFQLYSIFLFQTTFFLSFQIEHFKVKLRVRTCNMIRWGKLVVPCSKAKPFSIVVRMVIRSHCIYHVAPALCSCTMYMCDCVCVCFFNTKIYTLKCSNNKMVAY